MSSTAATVRPSRVASPAPALPPVVGADLRVPLVTGGDVAYANLDHAASAPCLQAVRDAVDEVLPWYASVHRGAGLLSQASTRIYENARETVRRFVDAPSDHDVVFTRNTTDALNLVAAVLPAETVVVTFDADHHAALLPWGGHRVRRIRAPRSADEAVAVADAELAALVADGARVAVVLTAASNVTGELWPVAELAEVSRRHGALSVLDAAQWAPHRPVSVSDLGVDFLAFSGHKVYAPFGCGALAGPAHLLRSARPYLRGGGASTLVESVGADLRVTWADGVERQEAGTPNVVGAHALAVACDTLSAHWRGVVEHEDRLARALREGIATVPGTRPLRLFDGNGPSVGVVSFGVDGTDPALVAAVLSAEYGIGVRDGAFCAHVATERLLARAGAGGRRAVRVSVGLGSTEEHVERLLAALRAVASSGPAWSYAQRDGRWVPVPDPRPVPAGLPWGGAA
ncbi:aminotransferase class V-fold PLP-dependent enzyme [Actinoalloteichus spitiensis]|uniref:aminotransferase class V-fold PLP-dependent enzyme n=1 Tax=Actinoalloteichus spitiensis TaxID=252394 RepID=UPI00035EF529|nr:aminotransferase class V-fold PLP-dependent enzyme [Actinoalloteichus spitiensis]